VAMPSDRDQIVEAAVVFVGARVTTLPSPAKRAKFNFARAEWKLGCGKLGNAPVFPSLPSSLFPVSVRRYFGCVYI
jgi:hypothetical protein